MAVIEEIVEKEVSPSKCLQEKEICFRNLPPKKKKLLRKK